MLIRQLKKEVNKKAQEAPDPVMVDVFPEV